MNQVRLTVSIDPEIVKKLRKVQSKKLETSNSSVSLSKVVEEILARALK